MENLISNSNSRQLFVAPYIASCDFDAISFKNLFTHRTAQCSADNGNTLLHTQPFKLISIYSHLFHFNKKTFVVLVAREIFSRSAALQINQRKVTFRSLKPGREISASISQRAHIRFNLLWNRCRRKANARRFMANKQML